jgi:hypothetical protein
MGPKDYKRVKRYVKVTEQRKQVLMGTAWGEVKNESILKAV